jgi:hypothetical protein
MGYSFSGAAVPGTEKTSSAPIMRKRSFFMDAAPRKCEPDLSIASGESQRLIIQKDLADLEAIGEE